MATKRIQILDSITKQADWAQTDETQKDYIKNKPDMSALYLVDAQNPNFEEAYAAYQAGKVLQMTNLPSNDSHTINSTFRIDFYNYYQGATLGSIVLPARLDFFGLAWSTTIGGYVEALIGLNQNNTCSITYQPLRSYLSTAVGGTMEAPLTLAADPTEDLEAATKQYVDNIIPTETDAIELAAELNLVSPVAADDGSIYTDENGAVYIL